MAKRRVTVDNDHLTLVVRKRILGLARNVQLVSDYGTALEEAVMVTENYFDHSTAADRAQELSKQLNVKMVVEE